MFMCTPTDVYAVPEEIVTAAQAKFQNRASAPKLLTQSIAKAHRSAFL